MLYTTRIVFYVMAIGYSVFFAIAWLPVYDVGGRDVSVRCPACQLDQSIPSGRPHFRCQRCGQLGLTVANFAPATPF